MVLDLAANAPPLGTTPSSLPRCRRIGLVQPIGLSSVTPRPVPKIPHPPRLTVKCCRPWPFSCPRQSTACLWVERSLAGLGSITIPQRNVAGQVVELVVIPVGSRVDKDVYRIGIAIRPLRLNTLFMRSQ